MTISTPKPFFLFFIGFIVFAIVMVFISANLNIRKKHKNVKRDFIKCPRWKSNDEKVENTQQVENLISEKLIDEFHLFINPAAIGAGMSIFSRLVGKQNLKLIKSKGFDCGITVLNYQI